MRGQYLQVRMWFPSLEREAEASKAYEEWERRYQARREEWKEEIEQRRLQQERERQK